MSDKTTYSLYIDSDLKSRLKDVSTKSGLSMAEIIQEFIKENLPQYEKKYGIQPKLKL